MLRDAIVKDFGWKLLSVALAIAIWLTVKGISSDSGTEKERTFTDLPVQIVSGTTDVRKFRTNPDRVQVTVKGQPALIKALPAREIHVMVDVTAADPPQTFRQRVAIMVPPHVTITKVEPAEVEIIVPPHPSTVAPRSEP